ncbi:MAG TPA: DUF397 domain-containing protein [Pseudonocardiaceae bacterium]
MPTTEASLWAWRKSSYSAPNGQCVEFARVGRTGAFRDSKNPTGPTLLFPHEQVTRFLGAVRAGRFDLR